MWTLFSGLLLHIKLRAKCVRMNNHAFIPSHGGFCDIDSSFAKNWLVDPIYQMLVLKDDKNLNVSSFEFN
jgi:hypothetical protein